jgi:hypothetical protein
VDLNKPEDHRGGGELYQAINGWVPNGPQVQERPGDYATVNTPGPRSWGHLTASLGGNLSGNQRNAMAFDEDFLGILKEG